MLVIAQHTNITDPVAFWAKAQSVVGNTPAGSSVLSVFPSQDGKTIISRYFYLTDLRDTHPADFFIIYLSK